MSKRILPKIRTEIGPGARFGRLVVQSEAEPAPREKRWLCRCDCGKAKTVRASSLRNQDSRSCGCLQKERAAATQRKHGHSPRASGAEQSPEYIVWMSLKARCLNPGSPRFADYGGRGITVCARWLGPDGFSNFLADMGPRPSLAHSIDRFPDNDGHYEPGNCRWATRKQQANNKRNNVWIEFRGERRTVTEWAEAVGLPLPAVYQRLNRLGWSVEKALTTPKQTRKRES